MNPMKNNDLEKRMVLPYNVVPIRYNMYVKSNFENDTFSGKVDVLLKVNEECGVFYFNSIGLNLGGLHVLHEGKEISARMSEEEEEERVKVVLDENLEKGWNVKFSIAFDGEVAKNMKGYYISRYLSEAGRKKMFSTHFEPTAARYAFPCWDQPDMKAVFSITLNVPKDLIALSNSSIKSIEDGENGEKVIAFEDTPSMPTYLVAYVVGELEGIHSKGKGKTGLDISVYSSIGESRNGQFALEVARGCIEFFEGYFGIQYPLMKLDMVAIPEFAMGAMENWGLVTYRKASLLYDESNSPVSTKKVIAETICHELAHQWFGNMVTMKWWNDLWLNEGFATWAAALGVSKLKKDIIDWDVWTSFISSDMEYGMAYDGLHSSHPIEVPVSNPNEIDEIFDGISYSKGASLIRMVEDYIGHSTFMKGIKLYLERNKYGNAETDDLWGILEEVSQKRVRIMMRRWTGTEGFPLLKIEEDGDDLIITQERFLLGDKEEGGDLWFIPLKINFFEGDHVKTKTYEFSDGKELRIKRESERYKINEEGVGFYRVLYSSGRPLQNIVEMIKENKLSPRNKLNFINDAFQLAIGTYWSSYIPLSLSNYFKDEENYDVMSSVLEGLNEMKSIFYNDDENRIKIEELILSLVGERAKRIDLRNPGITLNEISLNATILGSAVANNDGEVIGTLLGRFDAYMEDKGTVHPVFRSALLSAVIKSNSNGVLRRIYSLYHDSKTLDDEKRIILLALGLTPCPINFMFLLNELNGERIKLQDRIYLYNSLVSNYLRRDETIKFTIENFGVIRDEYDGNYPLFSYIVETVFSVVSSGEIYNEVVEFLGGLKDTEGYKRAVDESLVRARIRNTFRLRQSNLNG
jgi:aminopeptidase N